MKFKIDIKSFLLIAAEKKCITIFENRMSIVFVGKFGIQSDLKHFHNTMQICYKLKYNCNMKIINN